MGRMKGDAAASRLMTSPFVTIERFLLILATGSVCAVEMTILVRSLAYGLAPAMTATALGLFHVGYLIADRTRSLLPMPTLLVLMGISSAVLALTPSCVLTPVGTATAFGCAGLMFNSAAQAVRRNLKGRTSVSIRAKNISKAAGMVIGGATATQAWATAVWLGPILLVCLYAAGVARHQPNVPINLQSLPPLRRSGVLLVAELLHHAHYFAYAYTFWYIAPVLIGPFTGVWFLVGWLAYFVSEIILRSRVQIFSPAIMAVGHLAIAFLVLAMTHLSAPGVLVAWFLTGIGGGTAYMLGNVQPQGNREVYEDIGHVTGASIAAIVGWLAGGTTIHSATATLIAAASLACATAGAFWAAQRKHPRARTNER